MSEQDLGPYRILSQLGAGGMGVVYEAEDPRLQRRVAIKVLPVGLGQDRDAVDRFLREARIASSLNHPNICAVHDVGEHEGRPYIVMERLDGEPLTQAIGGRPVPLARFLDLGSEIADALDAAHGHGIVHRDIKPSNVFVTRRGQAKVLDFGVAKLAGTTAEEAATIGRAVTLPGLAIGTVSYMSPEQARGEPIDARSDLFSLGVVLYEMATGRQPFAGATTAVVFDAILNRAPQPPSNINPALPDDVARIIDRALEKDRALRFQSAADLRAELQRVRRTLSAPMPVAASSGSHRAQPATRRWRQKATAAAVVAGIAAGGAAWWMWASSTTSALSERDTVLIADFANSTGDPVFDETLTQALGVQLQESPFLTLLSDQRVQGTLRQMERQPGERVIGDVAREVCQRAGAAAMMAGSIAALGSNYVVTLEAHRCDDGEPIAREQEQAQGKEQVLAALGEAAGRLRARLGETRDSLRTHTTPVVEATTSSLDALKAYSMGLRARRQDGDEASLPLFRKAVELDPSFALAHARLATVLGNRGLVEDSAAYATRAYHLRGKVNEYERLYIEATYHSQVTGDHQQRINTLKVLAQTYPHDFAAQNNLATAYMAVGDWDAALVHARRSMELAPTERTPSGNVAQIHFWRGDFDEAERVFAQHFTIFPDQEAELRGRMDLAGARNDPAAMARVVDAAPERLKRIFATRAALHDWRLDDARRLTLQCVEDEIAAGRQPVAAGMLTELATFEAVAGRADRAVPLGERAVALDGKPAVVARLATLVGGVQPALAERWLARTPRALEGQKFWAATMIAPAQAAIAIGRRRSADAVKILQDAAMYERRFGVISLLRGRAYGTSGEWDKAAREFEKTLAGRYAFGPTWPAVQFHLAEAKARSGDTQGARAAYETFLAAVPRADADLPLVIEARRALGERR